VIGRVGGKKRSGLTVALAAIAIAVAGAAGSGCGDSEDNPTGQVVEQPSENATQQPGDGAQRARKKEKEKEQKEATTKENARTQGGAPANDGAANQEPQPAASKDGPTRERRKSRCAKRAGLSKAERRKLRVACADAPPPRVPKGTPPENHPPSPPPSAPK
jgi:hypothetical protein